MAGAPSKLGLPLHTNVRLLVKRRRKFLLGHHTSQDQARCVQIHHRSASRYQPLPRRAQRKPKALRLDQTRQRHSRQNRPPACTLHMSQCTSGVAFEYDSIAVGAAKFDNVQMGATPFDTPAPTSIVPEPSAWAVMLVGFSM